MSKNKNKNKIAGSLLLQLLLLMRYYYTINGVHYGHLPPFCLGYWTLESKEQSSLGSDADARCTAQATTGRTDGIMHSCSTCPNNSSTELNIIGCKLQTYLDPKLKLSS